MGRLISAALPLLVLLAASSCQYNPAEDLGYRLVGGGSGAGTGGGGSGQAGNPTPGGAASASPIGGQMRQPQQPGTAATPAGP